MIKIGKHIDVSPLTKKHVPSKVPEELRRRVFTINHSASYDNFIVSIRKNKNVLLELKES